jgi:hypothetical protein
MMSSCLVMRISYGPAGLVPESPAELFNRFLTPPLPRSFDPCAEHLLDCLVSADWSPGLIALVAAHTAELTLDMTAALRRRLTQGFGAQ